MKNKWDTRVYIDLYAGPGLLRIRETTKFIWGSPTLALSVKDPFDKYIFCESKPDSMDALKKRVQTHFGSANTKSKPRDPYSDLMYRAWRSLNLTHSGCGLRSFLRSVRSST